MTQMTVPFSDSTDSSLLEEVISQAEKRMQAQLELAKAADQRALTFAGLLFAGVAVLIGLAFSDKGDASLRPELLGMAVGFVISAGLATWSARPISWHIVGNEPNSFDDDVRSNLTFQETRPETARNYQSLIEHNARALSKNAKLMKASMIVAFVTATAGIVAAL